MGGTRFKLNLNLQNLSMISIAEKLWDSQDIKNRIKNDFSERRLKYSDENWCEISKLVVEYAESLNLPESLSELLKKTILLIGQKIYDWILHVADVFDLDLIFTQKIYFSLGIVDETKIFDLYWRDLMARDNFVYKSRYFSHSPLFSLACIYGCEKFVTERKNEILDELSKFYPQIKEGDEVYNIISVSICLTAEKSIPENVASPQRMLELCLERGFSKATRYYWEKLDEVEKFSNFTNFAEQCWGEEGDPSFLMEKNCENLLFLINQMGEERRCLFFMDYAEEIIRLFLPFWPYQELIVDFLKYDWSIEASTLRDLGDFLILLSDSLNSFGFPLDNELVFKILQKAWGNISVDEKLDFLKEHRLDIPRFILHLNPEILNLLLNDPSVRVVDGKKIDSFIKEGFVELVKDERFGLLSAICASPPDVFLEAREFQKEIFSYYCIVWDLIERDESFGLIDLFLDLSAESEAERTRLKSKINSISLCRYLTEPRKRYFKFELADKFLKWRLETAVEIKNFKDEMKSSNFVILGSSGYVRIKSGDLSWMKPEDFLMMHPDENLCDNTDGLAFLKFDDATDVNPGVVLGLESFRPFERYNFSGLRGRSARRLRVSYVGIKDGDFVVFTVCQIWTKIPDSQFYVKKVVNLSDAAIKFYYETEEEVVKFKKTKLHVLVTENLIQFLLYALELLIDRSWELPRDMLDNFCEYSLIPSETIEEIKIRENSDVENFLDTYLIDRRNFKLVDYYLNWLLGSVKKTEVCKTFLNSPYNGALLCDSFLKDWDEDSAIGGREFKEIHRWLTLVDDMEKLKNDLFAINENIPEWFHTLFDQTAHSDVNSLS